MTGRVEALAAIGEITLPHVDGAPTKTVYTRCAAYCTAQMGTPVGLVTANDSSGAKCQCFGTPTDSSSDATMLVHAVGVDATKYFVSEDGSERQLSREDYKTMKMQSQPECVPDENGVVAPTCDASFFSCHTAPSWRLKTDEDRERYKKACPLTYSDQGSFGAEAQNVVLVKSGQRCTKPIKDSGLCKAAVALHFGDHSFIDEPKSVSYAPSGCIVKRTGHGKSNFVGNVNHHTNAHPSGHDDHMVLCNKNNVE